MTEAKMASPSNTTVERSKSGLLVTKKVMSFGTEEGLSEATANVDFEAITSYFMGFWRAPNVALALNALERYESKRMLTPLRKKYGQWFPPPEVARALNKTHQSLHRSNLPDTKDARNLRFVLKMLGCSLHENRPYNQFIKAKSLKQKRLWAYKYISQKSEPVEQIRYHTEPICPVRLKRLYHFFPDRFTDDKGTMYFNHKPITYDESRRVFFFGLPPTLPSDGAE